MFTGIIEEIGTVESVVMRGESASVRIRCEKIADDAKIGGSIAVNGTCLTVTESGGRYFTADIIPETFRRSNLCLLKNGGKVNLERALPAGGRMDGHFVQGHVDCRAPLSGIKKDETAVCLTLRIPDPDGFYYIVEKGSITLDGVSLTLSAVNPPEITVSIIPHTAGETTLIGKRVGSELNVEYDILGKYIVNSFRKEYNKPAGQGVTLSLLERNGFI